jgi:cellulose synthase/poly-beta-1,6-N-acetylglucosamine synthase-like glycosyltransferase
MGKKEKIARMLVITGGGALIGTKLFMVLFFLDPLLGVYSALTILLIFASFIITYAGYKDPSTNTKNVSDKRPISSKLNPSVSVVIPAKNDPVMIIEAARSCFASTYQNIEVILVNDGSTDNTGEKMDSLKKFYPDKLKVIHLEKNLGKRMAVREGIRRGPAKGDVIIFLDSDCSLDKFAIEKMVAVFEDPKVGAVSGHGRALNYDENTITKMQDVWYDGQFSIMKATESVFGTVTCCPGILAAYRREAILPALDKWADDVFLGAPFSLGDDRHLTSYVIGGTKHHIGKQYPVWKAKYCESAVVYTIVPSTFKKFTWQQIRWKKSWFRVFFFTAPYFFKDRNPFAAVLYYGQMIWSFLSPIVAFRSMVLLPLEGKYASGIVYVAGLLLVGLLFSSEFKMRNPRSGNMWAYRLLWSVMGFYMSSLEFYSFITVRGTSWLTR